MPSDSEPAACRAFFGDSRRTVVRLVTGGFSGSEVLLVEEAPPPAAGPARWVVKSFGQGTSLDRAIWVHGFMAHLRQSGIEGIPMLRRAMPDLELPEARPAAATLAEVADGTLWEAVEFLPGRPVAVADAVERDVAVRRLAAIHVAAATLPDGRPRRMRSRGVVERMERAGLLRERPWRVRWREQARAESRSRLGEPIAGLFEQAIGFFEPEGPAAIERIERHAATEPACQAVLRDVWSDHVLFEHGRVSGFIDFHAAGIDTVATDIARLVGSWGLAAGVSPAWEDGFHAYERVRPLDDEERRLVGFLHHAGVIVAIDNWFRWIVEERRTFPDEVAVANRLGRLVAALPGSIVGVLAGPR